MSQNQLSAQTALFGIVLSARSKSPSEQCRQGENKTSAEKALSSVRI